MSQKIKLTKQAGNFREGSARALYYEVLQKHDGKLVDTFVKNVSENPPSVPKKGKLKGKPEPVRGWITWFVNNGYMTIES